MSARFFTNEDGDTLLRKFAGVFEHNLFQGNPAETVESFTARLRADIQRSRYERRVEEGKDMAR